MKLVRESLNENFHLVNSVAKVIEPFDAENQMIPNDAEFQPGDIIEIIRYNKENDVYIFLSNINGKEEKWAADARELEDKVIVIDEKI